MTEGSFFMAINISQFLRSSQRNTNILGRNSKKIEDSKSKTTSPFHLNGQTSQSINTDKLLDLSPHQLTDHLFKASSNREAQALIERHFKGENHVSIL